MADDKTIQLGDDEPSKDEGTAEREDVKELIDNTTKEAMDQSLKKYTIMDKMRRFFLAIVNLKTTLKDATKKFDKLPKEARWGIYAGGGILALLLVLLIVGTVVSKFFDDELVLPILPPKPTLAPSKPQPLDLSTVELMITKANLLYEQGQKDEALDLFSNISRYSETLSNFNLGVAQLREQNYYAALESFQRAIDAGEDRAMSAVNAAMVAFILRDQKLYDYYVNLAESYLVESGGLPLYPYIYALVQYYKGNYYEALSPLTHDESPFYKKERNDLMAKLFLYYGDSQSALEAFARTAEITDYFDLGMLYARVGDYESARRYLLSYIEQVDDKSIAPKMAYQLTALKDGSMAIAATVLNALKGDDDEANASIFPIRVRLKESLFDVHESQRDFWRDFSEKRLNGYKILFFYAPYRVFDAQQALGFIRDGGINVELNNFEEAKGALAKGSTMSNVNLNIAMALRAILRNNIYEANALLIKSAEQYPQHAILQYNLGLSFAQKGDFDNAYRHFLRGYNLDRTDLLSAIFAMICADLTYRNRERINESFATDFEAANLTPQERDFYRSLLGFANSVLQPPLEWIEGARDLRNIDYALDYVVAVQNENKPRMRQAAEYLMRGTDADLVSSLLWLMADNYGTDPREIASGVNVFYKDSNVSLDALFYGPSLARELYVRVGYNIGALRRVEALLDQKVLSSEELSVGIMQALALTSIYLREFEKAYVIYNALIDEAGQTDSQTMFLAAVAAVGAGHHENAAALLALAKSEAPTNYESRYGLGILHQEAKNLRAALIQYGAMAHVQFRPEYFDFEIDTRLATLPLDLSWDLLPKPDVAVTPARNPQRVNIAAPAQTESSNPPTNMPTGQPTTAAPAQPATPDFAPSP